MATFSPQNPLAQLLTADAPLSPISSPDYSPWDTMNTDAFFYTMPPSPAESLMSSQSLTAPMPSPEPEQPLCISTQQLFDLPQTDITTEPKSPSPPRLSISIKPRASTSSASSKRSASPAPTVAKKARGSERISSKDFIPPDVSGLSKREARLVKNRAAAFLSRQRKREEFELMEVRLAELEKENARLLALTQGEAVPESEPALLSEVEQLRAQLAAAEERERELSAKLAVGSTAAVVKTEAPEQAIPMSPKTSPLRSSASIGLMVLLCALPTLLSMPSNNPLPSTFSSSSLMSLSPPSSGFDYNSLISNDFDWGRDFTNGGIMDLDIDDQGRISTADSAVSFPSLSTQTLAFDTSSESGSAELGQLGQLDISFHASQPENGKIRVRIHPSGSNSVSRASSPPLNTGDSVMRDEFLSQPDSYSLSGDPFLLSSGASSNDWLDDLPMPGGYDRRSPGLDSDFDACSSISGGGSSSGKRRVRIALKTVPTSGGEGGEWEVQFC